MKLPVLLFLLIANFPALAIWADIWEPSVIHLKDGTQISAPAQWRKKVPVYTIKVIVSGKEGTKSRLRRMNYPLHEIDWIQAGNEYYRPFLVDAGEEKVWCLGRRYGETNWFKVIFEERECLCNSSRRTVQAWLIHDPTGGKQIVLRRKRFSDRFEDPVLARSVLGLDPDAALCSFSEATAFFFSDEP